MLCHNKSKIHINHNPYFFFVYITTRAEIYRQNNTMISAQRKSYKKHKQVSAKVHIEQARK